MPNYTVNQTISVEVDESKFTPKFLADFSEYITEMENIEDHRKYLAEIFAQGLIHGYPTEDVEGYGRLSEMGIRLSRVCLEVDAEFPDGE